MRVLFVLGALSTTTAAIALTPGLRRSQVGSRVAPVLQRSEDSSDSQQHHLKLPRRARTPSPSMVVSTPPLLELLPVGLFLYSFLRPSAAMSRSSRTLLWFIFCISAFGGDMRQPQNDVILLLSLLPFAVSAAVPLRYMLYLFLALLAVLPVDRTAIQTGFLYILLLDNLAGASSYDIERIGDMMRPGNFGRAFFSDRGFDDDYYGNGGYGPDGYGGDRYGGDRYGRGGYGGGGYDRDPRERLGDGFGGDGRGSRGVGQSGRRRGYDEY